MPAFFSFSKRNYEKPPTAIGSADNRQKVKVNKYINKDQSINVYHRLKPGTK